MGESDGARVDLFRERNPETQHPVTFVELFFDLVFVFAVTQLSHSLVEDFSALALVHVLLLMAAVWWVWMFTSYITNWLNPELPSVRLMLLALMLAGLALSTSISKAFTSRGWVFAAAYCGMQLGRTLFMLRAIPISNQGLRRNFQRVCVWFAASTPFWVAGAVTEPEPRLLLWGVALAVEYFGPALRFWSPWLGASPDADWAVEGGHLSERSALFIIIALGESILMTGATFAEFYWDSFRLLAFVVAFVGSVAMWWIYFDTGAESGTKRILQIEEPGRLARIAYLYVHLPLVAGIVLTAVGDEIILKEPLADTDGEALLAVLGGPLLYLAGALLFKRIIRGRFQTSHVAGLALLAGLFLLGSALSTLSLAALTAGVLALVAAWETLWTEEEPRDLSGVL